MFELQGMWELLHFMFLLDWKTRPDIKARSSQQGISEVSHSIDVLSHATLGDIWDVNIQRHQEGWRRQLGPEASSQKKITTLEKKIEHNQFGADSSLSTDLVPHLDFSSSRRPRDC